MFSHQISGCLKEPLIPNYFLIASLIGAYAERQENEEDVGFNERKSRWEFICVEFEVKIFLEIGKKTVEGKVNVGDNVIRVMFPGTGKKRRDLDLGWGRGKIWREWEEAKWRK